MEDIKGLNELYGLLLSLKTKEDCEMLLQDLCTYNEIKQMSERAYAARLFLEGNTYSMIMAETELSSATVSRVSRCVFHGSGGYSKLIKTNLSKKGKSEN